DFQSICGLGRRNPLLARRRRVTTVDLFDKFARALALAYDGIRLSGVSTRLFPSERAVCGLNSSKCFENQCPKPARSFVVSLTELKNHISTEGENMNTSEKRQAASITWFEIPADDIERAKK